MTKTACKDNNFGPASPAGNMISHFFPFFFLSLCAAQLLKTFSMSGEAAKARRLPAWCQLHPAELRLSELHLGLRAVLKEKDAA